MKVLRHTAIVLLIFNGLSALGGGAILFIHPDGDVIQMPVSMLENSPFQDFFIPGILLFIFNGLLSILFAISTVKRCNRYPYLICLQGGIAMVWIITQIVMIRAIVALHYIYGSIGLALLIIGLRLIQMSKHKDIYEGVHSTRPSG